MIVTMKGRGKIDQKGRDIAYAFFNVDGCKDSSFACYKYKFYGKYSRTGRTHDPTTEHHWIW